MSAFDAAVLLIADGLVAVGKVVGRARRRCGAERRADCLRRADALADMEASRDHIEPGDITHVASIEDVLSVKSEPSEAAKAALIRREMAREFYSAGPFFPEPSSHGFSGECPSNGSSCGCGRSAAVTTPAADNTPDHVTALLDYHIPVVVSSGFWGCEGCSWIGPKTGHSRHVAELITDMTAATGRVQQKLGGAS